jgi:hypothetical protein
VYEKGEYRPAALKRAEAKVLASFEKADVAQKNLMASIRKADVDTFKRLNDALNASKESDPKDKLGNTVPSAQTQYLERQLIGHLASSGLRNDQAASPAKAGIKPQQLAEIEAIGPGGPGGGSKEVARDDSLQDTLGITALRQGRPSLRRDITPSEVPQITGTHPKFGEVELMGERPHPQTGEVVDIIRLQDGTLQAVRKGEFKPSTPKKRGLFSGLFDTPETLTGGGGGQ